MSMASMRARHGLPLMRSPSNRMPKNDAFQLEKSILTLIITSKSMDSIVPEREDPVEGACRVEIRQDSNCDSSQIQSDFVLYAVTKMDYATCRFL